MTQPNPMETAEAYYNPPVEAATWVSEQRTSARELLAQITPRLALSAPQAAAITWHEGVFAGGSRLRFDDLEASIPAQTEVKVLWFLREPAALPITRADLLYEDEDLVVVNKPAWLPTQAIPSSARFALEPQLRMLLGIPTLMALHRLDRQTSGVVAFAKTGDIAGRYMQLFTQRQVHKRYVALTTAAPATSAWTVQGYLSRDFGKLPRVFFRLTPHEQPKSRWSETHFRVHATHEGRTLLEAVPLTGRTHQIRVHLAASRCFVWGDTQYGYPTPAKHAPASRLQLHAHTLAWPAVPRLRVPARSFTAPPPADFLFPFAPGA